MYNKPMNEIRFDLIFSILLNGWYRAFLKLSSDIFHVFVWMTLYFSVDRFCLILKYRSQVSNVDDYVMCKYKNENTMDLYVF